MLLLNPIHQNFEVSVSDTMHICDRILENLPFGHINQSDVIIHIS